MRAGRDGDDRAGLVPGPFLAAPDHWLEILTPNADAIEKNRQKRVAPLVLVEDGHRGESDRWWRGVRDGGRREVLEGLGAGG